MALDNNSQFLLFTFAFMHVSPEIYFMNFASSYVLIVIDFRYDVIKIKVQL